MLPLFLLLACTRTPEDQCLRMVDELCENADEACGMSVDDCLAEIEDGYRCAEVRMVSEDYGACLDAIASSHQCLIDQQLPGVCAGVLSY